MGTCNLMSDYYVLVFLVLLAGLVLFEVDPGGADGDRGLVISETCPALRAGPAQLSGLAALQFSLAGPIHWATFRDLCKVMQYNMNYVLYLKEYWRKVRVQTHMSCCCSIITVFRSPKAFWSSSLTWDRTSSSIWQEETQTDKGQL